MAEGVRIEWEEERALGGGLWQQRAARGGEDTRFWTWRGEGSPGGASLGLNGTLSQGCIKGTLSAPQPCRPLLCLAALPPHTQPHCHRAQCLSQGPLVWRLSHPSPCGDI